MKQGIILKFCGFKSEFTEKHFVCFTNYHSTLLRVARYMLCDYFLTHILTGVPIKL